MNQGAMRIGVVLGVVTVLAVGAAFVPRGLGSPSTAAQQATRLPLRQAAFACPESAYAKDATRTDLAAVAPAGRVSLLEAGARVTGGGLPARIELTPLGEDKPVASGERRARLVAHTVRRPRTPPMLISAQGTLAPGAMASQLTRTTRGELRGLAEASCPAPRSEFWFVGAGSQIGRHGRLHLTNVDSAEAHVALRLWDENGPVDLGSGRSVVVPPGDQTVVELDQLAPTSKRLAVLVRATRGRISAALWDDAVDGETPVGIDWIPTATRPAREVVLPAVAGGAGPRTLTVVAPGDSTATVDLTIIGRNGSFEPVGLGTFDVEPGSVKDVRIDKAVRGEAVAIRLVSDVPITATVRSQLGSGDGPRDVVYSAAAAPLSSQAVVPYTPTGDRTSATLILATPSTRRSSRLTVTLTDSKGQRVGSTTVVMKPGSSVEVPLKPKRKVPAYVALVELEDGGPIYGARFLVEKGQAGPMISGWQLEPGVTSAVRPVALPDLGAAVDRSSH